MAAGNNTPGQLGDGTKDCRLSPVQVASNVAAVSAGDSHTMFLKSDNTLWAAPLKPVNKQSNFD